MWFQKAELFPFFEIDCHVRCNPRIIASKSSAFIAASYSAFLPFSIRCLRQISSSFKMIAGGRMPTEIAAWPALLAVSIIQFVLNAERRNGSPPDWDEINVFGRLSDFGPQLSADSHTSECMEKGMLANRSHVKSGTGKLARLHEASAIEHPSKIFPATVRVAQPTFLKLIAQELEVIRTHEKITADDDRVAVGWRCERSIFLILDLQAIECLVRCDRVRNKDRRARAGNRTAGI